MTEIFLFIDALGWEIAGRHRFLADLLPYRQPLRMQFGYSCAAIPTLLSGRTPAEHGHLSLFRYAPEDSPFRTLARWAPLFKPAAFWERGRVRHQLSRLVKLAHGYTGYFQLYNMPVWKLGYMDYCEKHDLFARHGLAPLENLCDRLTAEQVPFHISDWRRTDADNLAAGIGAVRSGARFLFLYTAQLDALLHRHVRQPGIIEGKLRWYGDQIRQLLAAVRQITGGEARLTVVSDHGMSPLAHTVDIMAAVTRTGLVFGRDYGACYDSTMARFYLPAGTAADSGESIRRALAEFAQYGHFITREEETALEICRQDRRFGDLIFLLDPGVQIAPSDMGRSALPGMHGYTPEDRDSTASLLSTHPLPPQTTRFAQAFDLMIERATALKG